MSATQTWRNWSGVVECVPQQVVYPTSVDQVVEVVQRCNREGRTLRLVGSGHSFTALVHTTDILMSLDHLAGIIEISQIEQTATVWAGTKLKALGELLFNHGLAQENLGDINVQSVAGAISTGTHGTGVTLGTLATQVVRITAVLGNGEVVTCSADDNADLFHALQVSLGSIGVIVQVTLRLIPAYRLVYESSRVTLDDCLSQLEDLKQNNRHIEFYCFPYSRTVQLKRMNRTDSPVSDHGFKDYFNKVVMENYVFGALSGCCKTAPGLTRTVSRLSASSVPVGREVNWSHRLFATPRLVRFNEMEYNIPAEHMAAAIREVLEYIERERIAVHFPIECRFVRGDDIWLSPAYGRDSAYIAVHMYRGMPYESYFHGVEAIMKRFGGRPHWGKLHYRAGADIAAQYPKWGAFHAVRQTADANGVLLNDYLRRLFGEVEA
ncbi:D-arabinono-1,4-lactone oxidase [Alicyclobacillus sp. ALC3]|uniref:D-arabinono-1,4-lactone oxidase n=1 Tax=Alicyclobacillus sp. ALC3 TaxID=2796143 RepID=UPI00237866D3|nr:D-arabinono-1,4-lactone oxidase [Alicyclobacillus sp. ALC3]WDL99387.1 FAD-binding protein [Alicyclobacillus sp. ALC3]